MVYDHLPNQQEHVISEPLWWGQTKPILPIYRLNRIGRKISLLNVQYNGPLEQLKNTLISNGWEEHNESFTAKLLMRMNKKDDLKFPLLSQLYENKPPKLVLTYKATDGQTIWVFYLWTSHYRMKTHNNLLWIGSIYQIYPHLPSKGKQDIIHATPLPQTLYTSLSAFNLKRLDVYKSLLKPTVYPTMPMILLIKEK